MQGGRQGVDVMQIFNDPITLVWCVSALVATFLFGWGVGRMHSYKTGLEVGGEVMLEIVSRLAERANGDEEDNVQRDTV